MERYDLELQRVMSAISGEKTTTLTIEKIVVAACSALDLDEQDVVGPVRERQFAEARFIIVGLGRNLLEMKPTQIAEHIGDRDRSTVYYALKVYQDMLDTNKEFRHKVELVMARLEEKC